MQSRPLKERKRMKKDVHKAARPSLVPPPPPHTTTVAIFGNITTHPGVFRR